MHAHHHHFLLSPALHLRCLPLPPPPLQALAWVCRHPADRSEVAKALCQWQANKELKDKVSSCSSLVDGSWRLVVGGAVGPSVGCVGRPFCSTVGPEVAGRLA